MATLGLGVIVSIVIATEDGITGGPDGMTVPPLAIAGVALQGERVWYWIVGACLLVAVWLATNLISSPIGPLPARAAHVGARRRARRHRQRPPEADGLRRLRVFAAFAGGLAPSTPAS
jgi:ABC-type branched-chain amino acid transport system, permease component